jgi:phosphoribosylamine--glycine ligase
MKAIVVGSGAREHALAVALARTADVVVTPGNPGTVGVSPEGHTISSSVAPPESLEGDLIVVGPEAPLVGGLADRLRARGLAVVGPGADGAQLEGSKAFMKELCARAGVPTAAFGVFTEAGPAREFLRTLSGPYVVKTDGLASGKGVLVTSDLAEAEADVAAKLSGASFGQAGKRIVIEEAMAGPELSLLVLTDGQRALALPPAQDFKRVGVGDTGPNTGGMGAYSPVPEATDVIVDEVMAKIIDPTLAELRRSGIAYRGVLYAGLMLTESGPKLIEYNIRLGDPEAEVVLPLLDGDVAELFLQTARGALPPEISVRQGAAVCVVSAAPGYPTEPRVGQVITGIDRAGTVEGVTVYHAGTRLREDGATVVAGGRVIVTTAVAPTLSLARARAYEAVDYLAFDGAQTRSDIALDAVRAVEGADA